VRVGSGDDLRRALWLTPRWGEAGWEQLSATELAALLARKTRGESFSQFLVGNVPALAQLVDRHEPPVHQTVDAGPFDGPSGLTVSDHEGREQDEDEGAPMRAITRRFGAIFGCACSDSRYMANGPRALHCAGCGRQLRLSGPILVDSLRTEAHNSLEDLDYDALHGASIAGSRHLGNRWLEHIRQKIPLPEPLRILEIGAGTGQLTLGLVLNGGFESLIVSDLSEKFLLANLAFIRTGLETLVPAERDAVLARLCFLSCAVEDLPVRPESVNVVVASSVLHHMDDYESALRKLHRVLVPGGIAFFSEPVIEGKAFVGFMASLIKQLDERAEPAVFTTEEHKLLGDLSILCTRGYWESVAPQLAGTADDKHMFSMAQLRQCALAQGWSGVDAFAYDPIEDGLLGIMENSLQMMQVRAEPLRTYRHVFEAFQRQVIDEVPQQVCTPHAFVILRK
jgi:ubiquinone/menaquinone biosynthesis C-methylase UbiE